MADNKGQGYITEALTYLSTTETVEVDNHSMFGAVFRLEGSPEYYPNGAIKKTGKVIETINHK